MSTQPQTEEYLEARRESCRLLGLNADDLTAHETIRADLLTVLRLWLDSSQSTLIAGGTADPTKILAVADVLGRLVPEAEHKTRREDPRQHMLRTYKQMRERGAQFGLGYDGKVLENERLKAKIAELEAALAARADLVAPETSSARAQPPPPPAGNVVNLPRAGAGLQKSAAAPAAPLNPAPPPPTDEERERALAIANAPVPQHVRDTRPPNEAWRNFVRIDWQG
jgi:hypothetical protein